MSGKQPPRTKGCCTLSYGPAAVEVADDRARRITIYGPKDDGTYTVEFRTAAGESLAISVPRGETAVLKHFQALALYGIVVTDVS